MKKFNCLNRVYNLCVLQFLAVLFLEGGTVCNSYGIVYYNITFSSPPNIVGQPPITGIPVTTPSQIVFGQPIVSSSLGSMQSQPLVFNCQGNAPSFYYDQIQLGMDSGYGFYYTSFDYISQNLIGSRNNFAVLFDTPTVQNITFQSDGKIDFFSKRQIGYEDDQLMHFEIMMNISNKTADIFINHNEVYNGSFAPQQYLRSIRFSLGLLQDNVPADYSSFVGIDNIYVADQVPEPASAVIVAAGICFLVSEKKN